MPSHQGSPLRCKMTADKDYLDDELLTLILEGRNKGEIRLWIYHNLTIQEVCSLVGAILCANRGIAEENVEAATKVRDAYFASTPMQAAIVDLELLLRDMPTRGITKLLNGLRSGEAKNDNLA